MKEKLLTIILFLLLTIPVGIANDIVIPNNSLPYNIFKTVELPYAAHFTTSVFQDKKGMIWIGTYHGVCRYDGYKTTLYMQGRRIKLRCPPKVLTGTLHPSLPSIFSG